jgi:Tfp pilus assembly protein PilF
VVFAIQAIPPPEPGLAGLVARCRAGDCGGASVVLAGWDSGRAATESQRLIASRNDDGTLAGLAVLHTGAALVARAFDVAAREGRPDAVHYPAARRLVQELTTRSSSRPALRRFCSNWYVFASSLWLVNRLSYQARQAVGPALGPLGDDPAVLLAAGSAAEALMGPYTSTTHAIAAHNTSQMGSSGITETSRGVLVNEDASAAETLLKKTLAIAPNSVEARVRLGRVYQLLDRPVEARRELERVRDDPNSTQHPFARYAAALFLGDLHERANRMPDAEQAYRVAVAARPADQAASLALGHLLLATRRVDAGWATIRAALGRPAGTESTVSDGLDFYRSGQAWQSRERLAALEQWVRQ